MSTIIEASDRFRAGGLHADVLAPSALEAAMPIVLVDADIVDGTGQVIRDGVVIVEDGHIRAVGRRADVAIPEEATRISLPGTSLLPGLINAHDHLSAPDPEDRLIDHAAELKLRLTSSLAYRMTFALRYGQQELDDGVTTIRILGERQGLDADYRDAFDRGLVPGPRIITSGPAIATSAQFHASAISVVADGADGVRQAVRRNILADAQVIKLIVSGGRRAGVPRNMTTTHFTAAEVAAAVDEAHHFGLKVTAHLNGGSGVAQVLDAGVDGIEHGMELSDEELERAVAADTTFGLTLLWHVTDIYRRALGGDQSEVLAAYVSRLYQAGARMVLGNDHCHQGGGIARQMILLREFGVPAARVIAIATAEAAVACGVGDRRGTLRPGMEADIIAVGGDPMDDMRVMHQVRFVMKAGRVHRGSTAPVATA
jgi:imidazolonepropionase-like amidohydrolase